MVQEAHRVNINALLWAIFLAEGGCSASVPFGWVLLKTGWVRGSVTFQTVADQVWKEIRREYRKWRRAWAEDRWPNEDVKRRDFVRWLARVGYNAEPGKWQMWEKNVRSLYMYHVGLQTIMDVIAAKEEKKEEV